MVDLKLLAVFAHPDDESMGMGAALAKYSAEGVGTALVCATRGERGWVGAGEADPRRRGLGHCPPTATMATPTTSPSGSSPARPSSVRRTRPTPTRKVCPRTASR